MPVKKIERAIALELVSEVAGIFVADTDQFYAYHKDGVAIRKPGGRNTVSLVVVDNILIVRDYASSITLWRRSLEDPKMFEDLVTYIEQEFAL